jgi:anti-sigma factor RsiW
MECRFVLDRIEAIAAGDLQPDADTRAHLESCTRCASALATARRIEAVLATRPAPSAPAGFTGAVLQRLRRDRWRAEQQVDRLFNFAIAAAIVLVAGGVIALFNIDGLLAFTASIVEVAREESRDAAQTTAPKLVTYVSAAGLLASALAMWWWAERRWQDGVRS